MGHVPRFHRSQGFTLIELLVVLAIIALMVSILVPSLGRAKMLALRTLCLNNLRQLNVPMAMYCEDYQAYPCAEDPVSTSPFYWLWMGRGWRGLIEPYLGGSVSERNPSILFCKGDQAGDKYEATSYAYSMAFYHSPGQIDTMSTLADTYSNPQPSNSQRPDDVSQPRKKILIGEWTSNHPQVSDDGGWWCWVGERSFLFADGHTKALEAREILPARDGFPDANLTYGGIGGQDVE